jgi:hypothetical protein
MADREWFCVETPSGNKVAADKLMPPYEYPNKESAVDGARTLADQYDALIVVKYSRKEIRAFRRKVTVDEADLPA